MIERLLEYLGWDVREYEQVEKEKRTNSGKDVDYALKIDGWCKIYIEAKRINENLDNKKHSSQIIEYAAVDGIEWAILLNGDRIIFYKVREPGDIKAKIIFEIVISRAYNLEFLEYLKNENVIKGILEKDLNDLIITDKVIHTLEDLINNPPNDFIKYLESKLPEIKQKQIREAINNINTEFTNLNLPETIIGSNEIESTKDEISESSDEGMKVSRELLELTLPGTRRDGIMPSWERYHLIPIPAANRTFFPGFKIPFILETDIGQIETYIDGAAAETETGDLNAGERIRVQMAKWFRQHKELKIGDKLIIKKIEDKRYSLDIKE